MGKEAVGNGLNKNISNLVETLEAFGGIQHTKYGSIFYKGYYNSKAKIIKTSRHGFLLEVNKVKRNKAMEVMKRSRKRKQIRPRSLSGEISDSDIDDDNETMTSQHLVPNRNEAENMDGMDVEMMKTKISSKPLFSKLCISKKRRLVRRKIKTDGALTRLDVLEIINNSLQNSNVPCGTNRYRRHFLKQLHKAEQKRIGSNKNIITNEESSGESTFDKQTIPVLGENHVAGEIITEGRNLTLEEMSGADDGTLECKVCQQHFTTPGILSAHFITHSVLEREQTEAREDVVPDVDETCGKLDDSELDNEDDFNDLESHSDWSSCVDSEISGGKEKTGSDILESSTYFCHLCQERFTNITALQNHVQEHSIESEEISSDCKANTFCEICQKNFASSSSLQVHNKIHTGESPYTCNTCNKSFRDKTRLTTHIRVHTGEKPFICSVCQKSFSQKGNLKLHQKIHTGERNCVCGICGNAFRSRSDLIRHTKIHSASLSSGSENEETGHKSPNKLTTMSASNFHFESCESPARVLRSNKIKDLLEANDNITPIAALQGVKNLNELYTMGLHDINRMYSSHRNDVQDIRHKNDSYRCDRSQYKFLGFDNNSYMTNLNMEVEFIKAMTDAKMRAEKMVAKTYSCPLCGLTLQSFDAFNHHILLQHNPLTTFGPPLSLSGSASHPSVLSIIDPFMSLPKNDKYTCKDCNEVFKSYEELDRHKKSHRQKELDVKGPILARDHGVGSFLSSTAMMEDLKFTSHEKLYSCDFCLKTFRRSHHLQTHMRTHTGDRPYTCVECNKCFARGDHLQNHRRTHTGEKPYQCDVCDKSYSQSHHLLRHKRTHTGERPYHCTLCDKTFSRDHHLKKHLETHHMMDMLPRQQDCKSPTRVHHMPMMPDIPFNLVTQSYNRIGELMNGKQTENTAPKVCSTNNIDQVMMDMQTKTAPKACYSNRVGQLMIDMQMENSTPKASSADRIGQLMIDMQMENLATKTCSSNMIGQLTFDVKSEKSASKNMVGQLMNDMQRGYSTSKTHPNNRAGQLMIDMHTENSASKLMESMIKQHLREEGERKIAKTENSFVKGQDINDTKETIKITDILNDEIDKGMTSHISTDLILDHMMRATKKPDVAFNTKSDRTTSSMLEFSGQERTVTEENNSGRKLCSSQNLMTKDKDESLSRYLNVDRCNYGIKESFMDQSTKVVNPNVDQSTKVVNPNMDQSTKVLEPKTLEDIVARSLYQEYKLETD